MKTLYRKIQRWLAYLRWEPITSRVTDSVANVAAEIEYYDRKGRMIGFWAYGAWHPGYPYRGQ